MEIGLAQTRQELGMHPETQETERHITDEMVRLAGYYVPTGKPEPPTRHTESAQLRCSGCGRPWDWGLGRCPDCNTLELVGRSG